MIIIQSILIFLGILNIIWWILILFIKPILVKNNIIPFKGFKGITIQPFVFYREELELSEKMHELVHVEQQRQYSPIIFFIIYIFDYLMNLPKYDNKYLQYKNIEFEREAFKYENYCLEVFSDEKMREHIKNHYLNP